MTLKFKYTKLFTCTDYRGVWEHHLNAQGEVLDRRVKPLSKHDTKCQSLAYSLQPPAP